MYGSSLQSHDALFKKLGRGGVKQRPRGFESALDCNKCYYTVEDLGMYDMLKVEGCCDMLKVEGGDVGKVQPNS
jgi:hypothetical protein